MHIVSIITKSKNQTKTYPEKKRKNFNILKLASFGIANETKIDDQRENFLWERMNYAPEVRTEANEEERKMKNYEPIQTRLPTNRLSMDRVDPNSYLYNPTHKKLI